MSKSRAPKRKDEAMRKEHEETVKTSLRLPRSLWREAHIRALDEGTELQAVIAQALAEYLRKGGGR